MSWWESSYQPDPATVGCNEQQIRATVTQDIHARLHRLAERRREPMTWLVRDALLAYLTREEQRRD